MYFGIVTYQRWNRGVSIGRPTMYCTSHNMGERSDSYLHVLLRHLWFYFPNGIKWAFLDKGMILNRQMNRCPSKMGFPDSLVGKESACNAGDPGSIPGLGRSPGEGNGSPLQYSCLENPWTVEPGRLLSTGLQRVRHDWVISLSLSLHL